DSSSQTESASTQGDNIVELSPSELPNRSDFAAWLQHRQSQLQVTKTTKTPSGQTIDWIPIESQSPGPIATPPPTEPSYKMATVDAARPTQAATVETAPAG